MTETEKALEKEIEKQIGNGKTKIGLAVALVLVVILVISSLWLFIRVNSLQNEVDYLKAENNYLQWQLDEAQFDFYYVFPAEQKFGVSYLEDELYGLEWIEPYQEGVFDCSEMSAYMEWDLENKGWNTLIVIGDCPFASGTHAWLLVETSEGKYMPIEPTTIEIVWWDDPYFDNYFIYDYEFETILDALAYSETEFDWWG